MNRCLANRVEQLAPSGIRIINEKALELEQQGQDVLHFEIGRPDFDTPEYIKRACIASLENGDVFYTSNLGDKKLRDVIAEKLRCDNQCPYTFENILVTVGLAEGVFDVLGSILNEGDEILVPNPVWINYINIPKFFGAIPISYDLGESDRYQINIDELRSKITDHTKAIVISSPHNPTGSILYENTIQAVADLATKYDLIVISDEIYERLIYDGEKHISIASLPNMVERTFTLNGFSKAYSMTGWRIGYIAGPKDWIAKVNKLHQQNTTCAPSFVQKAAITSSARATAVATTIATSPQLPSRCPSSNGSPLRQLSLSSTAAGRAARKKFSLKCTWQTGVWRTLPRPCEAARSLQLPSANRTRRRHVHIEDWRPRYVYVEGIYPHRYRGGEFENVAILVAIAVNEDGYREVLGPLRV